MHCTNCGAEIDDNAIICPNCHAQVKPRQNEPQNKKNTIALVGFILSFFVAIAGLICSIIGLRHVKECGGNGKGFALAGIIISCVEILFTIIIYVTTFSALLGV